MDNRLLQVSTTHPQFVNQSGNWIRLRGANYNLAHHNFHNPPLASHLDKMSSWGFNFIRFPFNWYTLEPSIGNTEWSYLDEIESVVSMAAERSMYVLIDMHQWNTSPYFTYNGNGLGFPIWFVTNLVNTVLPGCLPSNSREGQSRFWWAFWKNPKLDASFGIYYEQGLTAWQLFGEVWRRVAWRLRNYWNVVGWDILNEPYNGLDMSEVSLSKDILPAFYKEVGTRIRWSDWRDGDKKSHILFIEGQDGDIKPSMGMPALTNFALSPHLYTAQEHWSNCQTLSEAAHKGLNKTQEWMSQSDQKIPLLLGEFGANANETNGARFAYLVSKIISVNGQSWSWWSYDPYFTGGYSLTYWEGQVEKDTLAVGELKKNLLVFNGPEC